MELVVAAFGCGLTLAIALFMRQVARRDKKAEEKESRLREMRLCEMAYLSSVGHLAKVTGQAVVRAELADGEIGDALELYAGARQDLEMCYNRMIAKTKGG